MAGAHASCFCGAVAIDLQLPVAWIAHYHCSMCRRYHGAPVVTWFGIQHGRYQLNEDAVCWYRSSAEAERGRCRACGSPLLFRSARWPDELHVVLTALRTPIDQTPQCHVYYDDRVPWLPVQPTVPCYRTVPGHDDAPMPMPMPTRQA